MPTHFSLAEEKVNKPDLSVFLCFLGVVACVI